MTFSADAPARPDSGIYGLDASAADARLVLIPVPFDATASYGRATAAAPTAILHASHQVDLLDREVGKPYAAGLHLLPAAAEIVRANEEACGAVDTCRAATTSATHTAAQARVNALGAVVNAKVREQALAHLERGQLVGVVGGDHSTPYGLIEALRGRHPDLGILHLDAHADLREAYEGFTWSHASIMHNALTRADVRKLVQVGVRDFCEGELSLIEASAGRVVTFFDADLAADLAAGINFGQLAARIVAELPHEVYVSFDIDGLDPALCPHTGTPVPGGLSFREACTVLLALVRSGRRIVGFDLTEVAPGPSDEWDANVGARLLYKLCGHALNSQAP